MQVLQPSDARKGSKGMHRSPTGGMGEHTKDVQVASCFQPLRGQLQALQPSDARKGKSGTHWPSGTARAGAQARFVHCAPCLLPCIGQTQVLQPSAERNGAPGKQPPPSTGGALQTILVHGASWLMPVLVHMHRLQPSFA